MNNVARGTVFALILSLAGLGTARADDFHYSNLIVGDRAAGMGGAYTAVSDDATGMYYNPAGIVYSTGRNLSASANAYYNVSKRYNSVIGGNGWERTSSSLLPNYFAVIQPVGKLKVGFSYAVPDSSQEDQNQTFLNLFLNKQLSQLNPGVTISTYIINFNNTDNTYQFGPSVAAEITPSLSAGLTMYVHERTNRLILNQLIRMSNGGFQEFNHYSETNEWGLRPVLGVMWSPMDHLSLGLGVSKVMIFNSTTMTQDTNQSQGIFLDSSGTNAVYDLPNGQNNSDDKRSYPTQVSAGAAYFATTSLLLSGDLNYFTKVTDPIFGDKEAVLNYALGAEYYLSKNWALRGGLFTNFSNTPDIKSGYTDQAEHIDVYGGSMSMSQFTRNTSVTLGGSVSYGSGEAQLLGGSTSIQDAQIFSWIIFLSSTYSY